MCSPAKVKLTPPDSHLPTAACEYAQPAAAAGGKLGEMDGEAETLPYECAFCGASTSDDPRWVRVSLEWERSEGVQQLGAHFACLRAALRPGFPLLDGLE